ncbi:hypothetical protein chiPu_0033866 [Chiloscyllium punctatum]|uniref:Uncharacterized protein n=1 Tax=Chiloscyllium punctatum TaxID=137246 RepID=A0A401U3X2_CHIPU|nr:hypothetical protein [Chiloscyllium punctatum]
MHHKVAELLENEKFVLTPARGLAYWMLLTFPDITIQTCTTRTSADYVSFEYERDPITAFLKLKADSESEPRPDDDRFLAVGIMMGIMQSIRL